MHAPWTVAGGLASSLGRSGAEGRRLAGERQAGCLDMSLAISRYDSRHKSQLRSLCVHKLLPRARRSVSQARANVLCRADFPLAAAVVSAPEVQVREVCLRAVAAGASSCASLLPAAAANAQLPAVRKVARHRQPTVP